MPLIQSKQPSLIKKLLIIDPALHTPESGCLKLLTQMWGGPVEYCLAVLGSFEDFKHKTNDMTAYIGCIILGSGASVNDRTTWQLELERILQDCLQKGVPILGICYGHQLMSSYFGAQVSWRKPCQSKNLGVREITLNKHPFWLGADHNISVWVSHKEEVKNQPKDCQLLASRSDCDFEGFQYGPYKAWSFQSHPEAAIDFITRVPEMVAPENVSRVLNEIESGRIILKNFLKCLKS